MRSGPGWLHGRVGFGDRRRVQPAAALAPASARVAIHPRAAANDCKQTNSTDHGRGEDEEADLSVLHARPLPPGRWYARGCCSTSTPAVAVPFRSVHAHADALSPRRRCSYRRCL
jgi:hypothetical protein